MSRDSRALSAYWCSMQFSDSYLDEIRQRLAISQVVGERVIRDKRKTEVSG